MRTTDRLTTNTFCLHFPHSSLPKRFDLLILREVLVICIPLGYFSEKMPRANQASSVKIVYGEIVRKPAARRRAPTRRLATLASSNTVAARQAGGVHTLQDVQRREAKKQKAKPSARGELRLGVSNSRKPSRRI